MTLRLRLKGQCAALATQYAQTTQTRLTASIDHLVIAQAGMSVTVKAGSQMMLKVRSYLNMKRDYYEFSI